MIQPAFEILNQRGTPMFFSDVFANRPTAGIVGRIFISTDTYAFYRDTGTGWDLIGGPGTGTITGSGATGQVSFFSGSSVLSGSNNLFWDSANNRLGIGTTTPGVQLDIHTTGTGITINGTTTNNAFATFQNAGTGKWRIGNNYSTGSNYFSIYDVLNTTERLKILNTGESTLNGELTISTSNAKVLTLDSSNAQYTELFFNKSGVNYAQLYLSYNAAFPRYEMTIGTYVNDGALRFESGNNVTALLIDGNQNSTFSGTITATINALGTAGTTFLTQTSGLIQSRTAAQVLSDIAALPLAGGTLTGALNGTSAVFSSSATATAFIPSSSTIPSNGMYLSAANTLDFATNTTNAVSINSNQKVIIGASSTSYGSRLGVINSGSSSPVGHFYNSHNTSGDSCMYWQLGENARDTSSFYLQCFDPTQDQLYIFGNGNISNRNGVYGTISDIALKENIVDCTPKLSDLLKVKIRNFNLIDSIDKHIGVIAQELEDIFPSMIEVNGKNGYKSVKYSIFIPMIIKAIQELKCEIDNLKN